MARWVPGRYYQAGDEALLMRLQAVSPGGCKPGLELIRKTRDPEKPLFHPMPASPWLSPSERVNPPRELDYREIAVAEDGEYLALPGLKERDGKSHRGDRKAIVEFSKRSRKAMLRVVGQVRKSGRRPIFATLTYPEWTCYERGSRNGGWLWQVWSPAKVKHDIDLWGKWLVREYPQIAFIWRMEFDEHGKIHVHMFWWHGPEIVSRRLMAHIGNMNVNRSLFGWLAYRWAEIVGEGQVDHAHLAAGVRVEYIRTVRGVWFYAAKYMAKEAHEGVQRLYGRCLDSLDEDFEGPGRFWGIIGRSRLPRLIRYARIRTTDWFEVKKRVANAIWLASGGRFRPRTIEAWQGFQAFLDWRETCRILAEACGVIEWRVERVSGLCASSC